MIMFAVALDRIVDSSFHTQIGLHLGQNVETHCCHFPADYHHIWRLCQPLSILPDGCQGKIIYFN